MSKNHKHHFSLQFKANLILSAALILMFLLLGEGYTPMSLATTVLGAVSTAIIFYLIFWIVLTPLRLLGGAALGGAVFSLFHLFIIFDFFVFRLYHTHINAMVLNIILSPAALHNIDFGVSPYFTFGALAIVLAGFQFWLRRALPVAESAETWNLRINRLFIPLVVLIVLADKVMFGWANLYSRTEIMQKMQFIPYYLPTDYNGVASKYFGIEPAPKPVEMDSGGGDLLDYPKAPLKYSHKFEKDNILIIMLDSVRWDMINEESSPNLNALKKESIVFDNHFSGGNATRFGVFSFFYGINSAYWFSFLDHQQPAVLIDALMERDFDIRVISSSDLNWPEFRRTIFAKINDKITDHLPGVVWEQDRALTDHALNWLDGQNGSKPFFGFLFYDAPHQSSYPNTHAKFKPDAEGDKNYLTLNASKRDVLFNQYKNSIYYDDALLGELIAKLKSKGLYEKTRIIVAADHGEEFYESGGFGHNNAFSLQQVKPMFFMRIPGQEPRTVTDMTSHVDVVPTIMHWLGIQNPASDYSVGQNLLDTAYNRQYAVTGNWNYNAIIERGHTLVFSAHPDPVGGTQVLDTVKYNAIDSAVSSEHSQTILRVMDENRKFYK